MNSVREIQRLNKLELEQGVSPSASWHTDYRDTAYVYVGGLPFDLTEGDIITIFSQFGEPTFVKLARDQNTGKSRGFGWVKYEDQRSCDLAVDNLGGATVLGRVIRVDHTRYKKRDDEDEDDSDNAAKVSTTRTKRDVSPEAKDVVPRRALLPEEIELNKLMIEHDEEDPMKEYLVSEKKKEVEMALERQRRKDAKQDRSVKRDNHERPRSRERRHRHHRSDDDDDGSDDYRGKDNHRHRHRHRNPRDDSRDRQPVRSRRHTGRDEDSDGGYERSRHRNQAPQYSERRYSRSPKRRQSRSRERANNHRRYDQSRSRSPRR